MEAALQQFHFLRPEWFWALLPAIALYLLLRARQARSSNWESAIDAQLLPFLLSTPETARSRSPLFLLLLAWVLATVALAGPVWRKTPQPVQEREDALVVIFDLTGSMYAEDVSPNRLVRARRKLQDLLDRREEGVTGLIVFSGDAHTVSPLTDDAETIAEMIPAISPEIMPAPGSELAPALELAVQLFQDAGVANGRILIITDEIRDIATSQQIARANLYSYPVSVLAVGTPAGAPIPTPDGSFVKDRSGTLVIPSVDMGRLADFAANAGGRFSRMTLTDEDLDYLLSESIIPGQEEFRTLERDFDVWIEEGPWLLLLLLPIGALAFRRGWVWSVAFVLILPVHEAEASWWDDLWLTRDQQGVRALEAGEIERAADLFEEPSWKGAARYREESFSEAETLFETVETSTGHYNRGNALAKQQDFQAAINAYDRALELDPENEDAAFNRKLLEELMQQQQQQQNQDQQGENQDQQQSDQGDQQQQNEDGDDSQEESNQSEDQEGEQQEQQAEQDQSAADQEQQGQQMTPQDGELNEEEQQALEQWLRRVPDDPGGLLRRKFQLQYEDRQRMRISTENDETADW